MWRLFSLLCHCTCVINLWCMELFFVLNYTNNFNPATVPGWYIRWRIPQALKYMIIVTKQAKSLNLWLRSEVFIGFVSQISPHTMKPLISMYILATFHTLSNMRRTVRHTYPCPSVGNFFNMWRMWSFFSR